MIMQILRQPPLTTIVGSEAVTATRPIKDWDLVLLLYLWKCHSAGVGCRSYPTAGGCSPCGVTALSPEKLLVAVIVESSSSSSSFEKLPTDPCHLLESTPNTLPYVQVEALFVSSEETDAFSFLRRVRGKKTV